MGKVTLQKSMRHGDSVMPALENIGFHTTNLFFLGNGT